MGIASEIITAVITILTLLTGFVSYENIKFRRENKKLKQNEVVTSDVDVSEKKIDLGDKYLEKVLKLTEKGNENQAAMMEKLNILDQRTDKQDLLIAFIVEYLNGDFNQFLARKQKERGQKEREQVEELEKPAEEVSDGVVG
jgi:hypothetical protein